MSAPVLRALRLRQWVKNLLLFLPILMAHEIDDTRLFLTAFLAFASFCLLASGVYVLNDLLDLDADKSHEVKRLRPFAAGELTVSFGAVLSALLLCAGCLLSFLISTRFGVISLIYLFGASYYSLRAKAIVVLDIILLSAFYCIRVIAGGVATDILVSEWLIMFSLFLFLSLACAKRFSELLSLKSQRLDRAPGRGYRVEDLEPLTAFGISSGYMAVLVMALYINSREVRVLYQDPEILWLICPILLYWISRVWLLAGRGELREDPVVFATTDKVSYFLGLLCFLMVLAAV